MNGVLDDIAQSVPVISSGDESFDFPLVLLDFIGCSLGDEVEMGTHHFLAENSYITV